MYSSRRKELSQNFFYSRKFVRELVRCSSIGPKDIVLDIGTGKGIISEALLPVCRKVIAIEIDKKLSAIFNSGPGQNDRTQIICMDFLSFRLPRYPYKVFSNIPFSIEGKIIRKLLDDRNPPEDSYLVVRKDLAYRLCYRRNSLFYLTYSPWFELNIVRHFRRTDFEPMARMDCVLLRIKKRVKPLLPQKQKNEHISSISSLFQKGNKRQIAMLGKWLKKYRI